MSGMASGPFEAFYEIICETFDVKTQGEVAKILEVHQPQIANWRNGDGPARKSSWKKMLRKLLAQHAREVVWPLFEFRSISPIAAGASWRIHRDEAENTAIREALCDHVGLYGFYDSAGRVLYVGKTANNLWVEIRQRLKARVHRHIGLPEKQRGVVIGQMATYLSAYAVYQPQAVHNLEALVIRMMVNDHANTNLGHFKAVPRK